ncbi:MAG: hypothetical protein ACYC96_13990 [Fimbriimonadaceae bacterium]
MKTPLNRLNTLTLAAEAALAANDFPGFRALLEERGQELAKLAPNAFVDAETTIRLNARLEAAAERRMDGLRTRMRHLAHVNRSVRAARAAREASGRFDGSG